MGGEEGPQSQVGHKCCRFVNRRTVLGAADRMQMVPGPLTADDIIPLVASLPDGERIKLLRWIASPHGTDASAYTAAPPARQEFSGDDESIAWEADGWDDFR
jgi:hypothetical protein